MKALAEHEALAFYPGSPGGLGWVLPDQDAFNAGVTDVICVFALDPAALAGGVGDVRELETSQVLPKFRICVSIAADRTRTTVPCDVVHDRETLAFVTMAVEGLPKDLSTWTDTHWAPFDAACAALGEVLMGGAHPEVKVAADTDFDIPAETGVRGVRRSTDEFSCNVKSPDAAAPSPRGHRDRPGRQEGRARPDAPAPSSVRAGDEEQIPSGLRHERIDRRWRSHSTRSSTSGPVPPSCGVEKGDAAAQAAFFVHPNPVIYVEHASDLTLQANYETHRGMTDEQFFHLEPWNVTQLCGGADVPARLAACSGRGNRLATSGTASIKVVVGEDWIVQRGPGGEVKFALYINTHHQLLPDSAPFSLA